MYNMSGDLNQPPKRLNWCFSVRKGRTAMPVKYGHPSWKLTGQILRCYYYCFEHVFRRE